MTYAPMTKANRLHTFQQQIRFLEERLTRLQQRSQRWTLARLISFLAAVGLSSMAFFFVGQWLFWICAFGLGALFVVIVKIHNRLEQNILSYTIWKRIKSAQVARMCLNWNEIPPAAATHPRYDHHFEADIDIVGPRSLHRLIDVSMTQEGSQRLRNWLTTTEPDLNTIQHRQGLVQELTPLFLFRTRLLLNGTLATEQSNQSLRSKQSDSERWKSDQLEAWFSDTSNLTTLLRWLVLLGGLAILNAILVALYLLFAVETVWPYTLGLYAILMFYTTSMATGAAQGKDMFSEATKLREALAQLAAVFQQLESYSYRETPKLQMLCQPFLAQQIRPSAYMNRLAWIVNATGIRGNPLIWFALNLAVPWDIFFGYQLLRCKQAVSQRIPKWLHVWFKLEALCSLANLAYLNPGYILPTVHSPFQSSDDQAVFHVEKLGHPLLPDTNTTEPKVCNDFHVEQLGQIALITGSNMAGKSTFLRSLGTNLALAFAGGPVDATRFDASLLRLFTSIKVSDSVTDGISYFYAEVKRLKMLLEQLDEQNALPLFFSIDEIFRGTNNRERLIGSRSYVRALAGRHGIGLISTHDLELVKLADELPLLTNYHFRDDIRKGRMAFDYILRQGPCPTTNALKIMAYEGLPVDDI